jgi:hypothetical protein
MENPFFYQEYHFFLCVFVFSIFILLSKGQHAGAELDKQQPLFKLDKFVKRNRNVRFDPIGQNGVNLAKMADFSRFLTFTSFYSFAFMINTDHCGLSISQSSFNRNVRTHYPFLSDCGTPLWHRTTATWTWSARRWRTSGLWCKTTSTSTHRYSKSTTYFQVRRVQSTRE